MAAAFLSSSPSYDACLWGATGDLVCERKKTASAPDVEGFAQKRKADPECSTYGCPLGRRCVASGDCANGLRCTRGVCSRGVWNSDSSSDEGDDRSRRDDDDRRGSRRGSRRDDDRSRHERRHKDVKRMEEDIREYERDKRKEWEEDIREAERDKRKEWEEDIREAERDRRKWEKRREGDPRTDDGWFKRLFGFSF